MGMGCLVCLRLDFLNAFGRRGLDARTCYQSSRGILSIEFAEIVKSAREASRAVYEARLGPSS